MLNIYLSKHFPFCHIGAGVLTNIHFHFRLAFLALLRDSLEIDLYNKVLAK
jgi:hypothetical protein